MRYLPLRRKIVIFVIAIMLTFLVTRGIVERTQSYETYMGFLVDEAQSIADTVVVAIAQGDYWDHPDRMRELLTATQARIGAPAGRTTREMLVTNRSGQVIATASSSLLGTALSESAQQTLLTVIDQGVPQRLTVDGVSRAIRLLAVPITIDSRPRGALMVEYVQDPATSLVSTNVMYEYLTIITLTMGLVLVLLVGIRKMVLLPLAALKAGAECFGKGDLDARIELETRDEMETVAEAFNTMAGELKAHQAQRIAREKQATLVDVACKTADELSQPLTVVLGYAELLGEQNVPNPEFLDEAVHSIQRGSQKMAHIVRELSKMSDHSGSEQHKSKGISNVGAPAAVEQSRLRTILESEAGAG